MADNEVDEVGRDYRADLNSSSEPDTPLTERSLPDSALVPDGPAAVVLSAGSRVAPLALIQTTLVGVQSLFLDVSLIEIEAGAVVSE
jgi:hypothetical protein